MRGLPKTKAARALLALGTLALLPACGHRGDPRPPLRRTPPAPTEFRLAQRGDALELQALAPAASVDGVVYDNVTVEFLHGTGQVDLTKAGVRLAVRAAAGTRALATLPLPAPGTLVRAAARAARGSERSPRTLTLALVAQPPLEAPRELVATLTGGGIDLAWKGARPKAVPPPVAPRLPGRLPGASPAPLTPRTGSGGPPAGAPPVPAVEGAPSVGPPPPPESQAPVSQATPPTGAAAPLVPGVVPGAATAGQAGEPQAAPAPRRNGFLVYRRVGNGAYGLPLDEEPLERRTFSDEAAPLGATLCYVVRAVGSTDPLIESAPSNEACLERRDVTPPEVPAGLAVLPRQGGLELLWSPSSEEDLAGYRVYRSAAGAAPERLAELDPGKASYLDESVQKGVAYRYTLTAFDQAGNESAPCEAVEATLP